MNFLARLKTIKRSHVIAFVEKSTTVGVYLAALTIIYVCAWSYFHKHTKPYLPIGLQKGQVLTSLPSVPVDKFSRTLLIAVNAKCGYCQESVPFYKQLSELAPANRSLVVAMFPNSDDEAQQFLADYKLDMRRASSVDLGALGIFATPTVILIDKDGTVRDFWVGVLSKDQEQQIGASLRQPAN
jgi:thiol-disulfide isomerase/thioredoxin